jgi:TIR domain
VKIFLSYPSGERDVAERLNLALIQQGHDVFFDRADLPPGQEYDQAIARAIAASDLFVFLITPASVSPGRYTLTEVKLAEERWSNPDGRVLPVMLRATEMAAVPNYLKAVNILMPHGDAVAETAHEVQRLSRRLSLTSRVVQRFRSPIGIAALVGVAAVSAVSWVARPWENGFLGRSAVRLPPDVRQRARAVVPLVDSGFAIATANPPRLVRFTDRGVQVGESIELMGDPVAATRTPAYLLLATRARDGVMLFDAKRLRLQDSTLLDPGLVRQPTTLTKPPRRSGDIQSVIWGRGDLWMTTGDRDGEPTVLRFRRLDRTWDVPTFTVDTAGFGPDAKGVRLRNLGGELWGARRSGTPSTLYHVVGFIRIDRFDGKDLKLVSCAHDVAEAPSGNVLFLSCDNELQEVSVDATQLTLVRARPTLPPERAPGTSSYDMLATDSNRVIVALNTVARPNDRPLHGRIAEVDSAGVVQPMLDVRDAVVQSMGVTRTSIVAVIQRANGSTDVIVVPRKR